MTMLQNSLLIDEEYEYEIAVADLWKAKGIDEPYDAISLAMKTFKYPNFLMGKEKDWSEGDLIIIILFRYSPILHSYKMEEA